MNSRITTKLLVAVLIGSSIAAAGCENNSSSTPEGNRRPIVIGTSNSLTGRFAPFEQDINSGMALAVADINAAGGADGRKIKLIHVDAKSDLNLSAAATLEVIEKGADVVVPVCDADLGGAGARAANEKGILAITCAGAPGIGRQAIGPLTFNTYQGSPTEATISAEWAYQRQGWRSAYLFCDQLVEYSKVLCKSFENRWKELGGKIVGSDTFLQSDLSVAAQVTRFKKAPPADFVLLGSFPAGSPALREIRSSYSGPLLLSGAYSGTFWLKATPELSNAWLPVIGSSYGDDPRSDMNRFFKKYKETTGGNALTDSYPILGYSLVQTIAVGVARARSADGKKLASALNHFRDEPLLAGPTTYTPQCHVPIGRPMLMLKYQDGQPQVASGLISPGKVPEYPC
ncbi:ABC transporter substrate-binding protein [Streptomyces sp. NPDC055109]